MVKPMDSLAGIAALYAGKLPKGTLIPFRSSAPALITDTTKITAKAAPGSGLSIYLAGVDAINTTPAQNQVLQLFAGAAATVPFWQEELGTGARGGQVDIVDTFDPIFQVGDNLAVQANATAAQGDTGLVVSGFIGSSDLSDPRDPLDALRACRIGLLPVDAVAFDAQNASLITDGTVTTIQAAPGSGLAFYATEIIVANATPGETPLITVAAGSNIIFQEFSAPNTGLRRVKLRPLLPGTDNGAITVALTDPLTSGFGDVRVTVRGFVGSVLS